LRFAAGRAYLGTRRFFVECRPVLQAPQIRDRFERSNTFSASWSHLDRLDDSAALVDAAVRHSSDAYARCSDRGWGLPPVADSVEPGDVGKKVR